MLGINVSSLLLLHYHFLHAVRIVKAVRRAIASRNTRDAEHSTLLHVRHIDDDEQLLVCRAPLQYEIRNNWLRAFKLPADQKQAS